MNFDLKSVVVIGGACAIGKHQHTARKPLYVVCSQQEERDDMKKGWEVNQKATRFATPHWGRVNRRQKSKQKGMNE